MRPDERRTMIVAAALPLVIEHGAAVTTAQIARAAGIGEGTIFRVFDDKAALVNACVAEALRPDHVLRELDAIPLDQRLTDRLVDAIGALRAHMERIGSVIAALAASGQTDTTTPSSRRRDRGLLSRSRDATTGRSAERDHAAAQTHDALVALLEPDRETLDHPPEVVAAYLLRVLTPTRHSPVAGTTALDDTTLADLIVHGVRRAPAA